MNRSTSVCWTMWVGLSLIFSGIILQSVEFGLSEESIHFNGSFPYDVKPFTVKGEVDGLGTETHIKMTFEDAISSFFASGKEVDKVWTANIPLQQRDTMHASVKESYRRYRYLQQSVTDPGRGLNTGAVVLFVCGFLLLLWPLCVLTFSEFHPADTTTTTTKYVTLPQKEIDAFVARAMGSVTDDVEVGHAPAYVGKSSSVEEESD